MIKCKFALHKGSKFYTFVIINIVLKREYWDEKREEIRY